MSLRILMLGLAVLVALGAAGTWPPTAAPPAVPTTLVLPPFAPHAIPEQTPAVLDTPVLPATPTPGGPTPRVVPVATRAAVLTSTGILTDVQTRLLPKLSASTGDTTPHVVELGGASGHAVLNSAQVAYYSPGTLSTISSDMSALNLPKDATLAVVVIRCDCDPAPVVTRGPGRPVKYLVVVYDPRYSAPTNIIWAPESALVQALTGNHADPIATLVPTPNALQRAAEATHVAQH